MQLKQIEDAFWLASFTGEIALAAILVWKKGYRHFPIFSMWVLFNLIFDPILYLTSIKTSHDTYFRTYLASSVPGYLLEIMVLFEIALAVLKHKRNLNPKMLLLLGLALFASSATAVIFVEDHSSTSIVFLRSFDRLNYGIAGLRLAMFILISAFSQVLGVTWRNRVLQLASGFAFYAGIGLLAEIAHSHLSGNQSDYDTHYRLVSQFMVAGYLCALYYWCYCFARQEAERKEFSPQMERFLVSMSGAVKRQRALLARQPQR